MHGKPIEKLTFGEVWNEIKENTARQMEALYPKKEEQGLRKEKYMKKLKELRVLAKELWVLGAARRKSGILDH